MHGRSKNEHSVMQFLIKVRMGNYIRLHAGAPADTAVRQGDEIATRARSVSTAFMCILLLVDRYSYDIVTAPAFHVVR